MTQPDRIQEKVFNEVSGDERQDCAYHSRVGLYKDKGLWQVVWVFKDIKTLL